MKDPFSTIQEQKNMTEVVATFTQKVATAVATDHNKVAMIPKMNKINDLQKSFKWVTVKEGGYRLGLKKAIIKRHCQLGHFVTRKVKMNGGFGYEISLESMFNYYNNIGDWAKCEKILEMMKLDNGPDAANQVQEEQNGIVDDKAMAKYQICKLLDEVIFKADKKTIAIERFVNSFNQGSYPKLLEVLGQISVRSLYRWYRTLQENNWDINTFSDNIKPTARTITNKEAEILIPMLLNPNRPLVSEILKRAKQEFANRGINIKSDITYRRFIEDWKNRNIDLYTLGRYGMKAFNDKIMKDILRDKDRVEVADIVVADGHTLNVMVINPLTGRPQRMTLIMFFDFKSSMPLGWEIMPTENILTIASALRRTILLLGRFFSTTEDTEGHRGFIPKIAYLDNGRAFRARYFRGIKDFRDSIMPGLFGTLGIETMYATPYHGQSKTIERWFKTLGELERRLPAYTGTDIAGKPAMLMRNEKLHQRLFDNTPIEIESLNATLQEFIQEYAQQPHQDGQYKGLTPVEVFMHSVEKIKSEPERLKGRLISKQELNYLMLSDETRTIGKNGIRFRGNYYYNEEMPRIIGNRINIKYDIWDDTEIIVLDEKDRYLFAASKDDIRHHPAARLLGDETDLRLLTESLAQKQRMKRETIEEFKQIVALTTINNDINQKQIEPKKVNKISEQERKKRAMKEYAQLIGYKPFANPVDELLRRTK